MARMSDPPGPFGAGFPFGLGDDPEAFRDAPLFRELQRVMMSSSGPINWELARQTAVATASEAGPDPEPDAATQQGLSEAVRLAELQVARFTGLEPPTDVAVVRGVRRAEWVATNVESLRSLLEPAAGRMTEAMDRAMGELQGQLPPEAASMAGLLRQLGPLLQGTQVGQVLGFLAQRVLGQYDVAVPRSGPAQVLFVVPTIEAFERDWSLDPTEFRQFVALHEVVHRFEFAQPWTGSRFAEVLEDFLSTITIDVSAIGERLASIDPANPEALQGLAESEEGLFGTVLDDEQRLKLARIQAFMAAAEGYGDHVAHGVARDLLSGYGRIEEAMRRHREDEPTDPVFERLLGVEMKRSQYVEGRRFCDTVASEAGEAVLVRMWDSAEAMPSLPEIGEPVLWLARTL